MPTILPTDTNNHPIQALRLKNGAAHILTAAAISSRNVVAFGSDTLVVSIYATVPVYIRFGSSSVTATASDHYFPSGVYYDIAIGGAGAVQNTHMALVRVGSTDGAVYISEKY